LALVGVALLVVQPSKLLKNLGVVRGVIQHALVSCLGGIKILLLLMNMADLEPDIFLGQRAGRRIDNVFETIKTLRPFVLLFIYNTQSEVNLICLFKVGLNVHDLRESLFGIVVTTVSVIEDSYSVPQHGVLRISQVNQCLLIGVIRLLEVFCHEVTVS
jgi:hypothetical protein